MLRAVSEFKQFLYVLSIVLCALFHACTAHTRKHITRVLAISQVLENVNLKLLYSTEKNLKCYPA